jgi:putative Ig domain-containing protein
VRQIRNTLCVAATVGAVLFFQGMSDAQAARFSWSSLYRSAVSKQTKRRQPAPAPAPEPAPVIETAPTVTNTAPTISGTPATSVTQDSDYRFAPWAADANGDRLTFAIVNQPRWAALDSATGVLSGRPAAADVGTYWNIEIWVTDGQAWSQLAPFSIAVEAYSLGSATLTWVPPTKNIDGSPLLDLAGYQLYWGDSSGHYTNKVAVWNPGITSYVIENLSSGTHFFAATAVSQSGAESPLSGEALKVVR